MKRLAKFIIINFLLASVIVFCGFAFADEIFMANGRTLKGIVAENSPQQIVLQVDVTSTVIFSPREVKTIEHWSDEQNRELEESWIKQKEIRAEEEKAKKKFEQEQASKGLIKYRGEWITKEKKEEIEVKSFIDSISESWTTSGELIKEGAKTRSRAGNVLLASGQWQHRQTQNFIIYFQESDQSKIVSDKAEYWREKIAFDLDYIKAIEWPKKCEAFIVPDQDKWNAFLEEVEKAQDLIGGFYVPDHPGEIFLCALSLPYLSVAFPHELTHLIFSDFAKGRSIPLWLNEGLANYESGMTSYYNGTLREKIKEGRFISVENLVSMKDYPREKEQIELFYAESEKIVEFLITQYGRDLFAKFAQAIINGVSFEEALRQAFPVSFRTSERFNKSWLEYIIK